MSERGRIRRVMVTGSSGMIGTALCEKLFSSGYKVIPVDLKPNNWNESINKKTVLVDLRDEEDVNRIPNDVEIIIHLAANSSVVPILKEPSLGRDNFVTTFNILEFARKNKISNFIFASSREVYGNVVKGACGEDDVNLNCCENPYAATKIAGEVLVKAYENCYGLKATILRFTNVYGKYDDSERVIPSFIRKTLRNEALKVFGEEKVLDFIFIEDVVVGIMRCLQKFDVASGHTFNVTTGKGTTIMELVHLIRRKCNSESQISIEKNRTGETMRFVGDFSLAKKVFGFAPLVSLDDGLLKTIEWHRSRVV